MKNPEGQRVWELIEESGVKRRFVARKLGLSYGYLNQLTYGHARLTPGVKAKFAAYFELPVAELFPEGGASQS
jgi:transcriptional regulator with XRE-family HTH domain